jgi:aspartate carbamoyltransferase catalytic subunit
LPFAQQHLIDIQSLQPEHITHILDTAESLSEISRREVKKVPVLRGKSVVNLFFEPSTRTRTSFELAAKRLSADFSNFNQTASSAVKGETLKDTALNLEAMHTDALIIRHSCPGTPLFLTSFCRFHVINAGDGTHEHPTQALLDALTIRQMKNDFKGLKVVITGDILHSRVARSNLFLLKKMGASVTLVGPPSLVPAYFLEMGAAIEYSLDRAIEGADIIMMLRIQIERQKQKFFPSLREYRSLFSLTPERLNKADKEALIMHPGPMNRGVEISSDLADSHQSIILKQVENGVAVRMAVLYLLLGEKDHEIPD